MIRAVSTEVHTDIDFFKDVPSAGIARHIVDEIGVLVVCESLIDKALRHASFTEDIAPVPYGADIILRLNLGFPCLPDGEVVVHREMLILIPAEKAFLVFVDVLFVDCVLRAARVEVPQDERLYRRGLTSECDLDEALAAVVAVVVLVDLRCNPQTIGVSENLLVAVRLAAARENDDFLSGLGLEKQRFIALVFAPFAAPAEQVFQPEAVARADVELGVRHRRTARKMDFIGADFEICRGDDAVVDCLARTNRAFRDVHFVGERAPNICFMLVRKRGPCDCL